MIKRMSRKITLDQQPSQQTIRIRQYSYSPNDKLGKGFSSIVYKGLNTFNGEEVAIKIVDLNRLDMELKKQLIQTEIRISTLLDHCHIVRTKETFQIESFVYMVQEYCEQGDLLKYIRKKQHSINAYEIINQVLLGLQYLRSKNIVHRDIKPANVFLSKGRVKIGDFGFAAVIEFEKAENFKVGSQAYMSPEVNQNCVYSEKSDVWAVGCVFSELLYGQPPMLMDESSPKVVPMNAFTVNQRFIGAAQKIINKMLEPDYRKRINVEQSLELMRPLIGYKPYIMDKPQVRIKSFSQNIDSLSPITPNELPLTAREKPQLSNEDEQKSQQQSSMNNIYQLIKRKLPKKRRQPSEKYLTPRGQATLHQSVECQTEGSESNGFNINVNFLENFTNVKIVQSPGHVKNKTMVSTEQLNLNPKRAGSLSNLFGTASPSQFHTKITRRQPNTSRKSQQNFFGGRSDVQQILDIVEVVKSYLRDLEQQLGLMVQPNSSYKQAGAHNLIYKCIFLLNKFMYIKLNTIKHKEILFFDAIKQNFLKIYQKLSQANFIIDIITSDQTFRATFNTSLDPQESFERLLISYLNQIKTFNQQHKNTPMLLKLSEINRYLISCLNKYDNLKQNLE